MEKRPITNTKIESVEMKFVERIFRSLSGVTKRIKEDGFPWTYVSLGIGCCLMLLCITLVGVSLLPIELCQTTGEEFDVNIPGGYTTGQIATLLDEEGVIRSGHMFKFWAYLTGNASDLKAGRYVMKTSESPLVLLDKLVEGRVVAETVWVTVPEGFTIKQMAERFEAEGLVSATEFFDALRTTELPFEWATEVPDTLIERYEGYLFPDTYEFRKNVTAHDIIMRMTTRFDGMIVPLYLRSELNEQYTLHELLTLASIVEKEAMVDIERPIIAGVFYNRLQRDYPLQSCATVQYLLPETKPVLSTKDTEIDSSYNTYKVVGLPPGPISSVSLKSFEGVLNPAETDYFFFAARADGTHEFSRTYAEHLRAVKKNK